MFCVVGSPLGKVEEGDCLRGTLVCVNNDNKGTSDTTLLNHNIIVPSLLFKWDTFVLAILVKHISSTHSVSQLN